MEMTIAQLRVWAAAPGIAISEHIDGHTEAEKPNGYDDETGRPIMAPMAYACAWKTAKGQLPGGTTAEITYQTGVQWNGTNSGRNDDEWEDGTDESIDPWVVEGITLVDEDGDELDRWERDEALAEIFDSLENIDYDRLLPETLTEDIDLENDMEITEVKRDNEPNIRFTGEKIASVSSKSAYNDNGRWTVLRLYKTKGGKFVCQSVGHTQWQGEVDRYSGAVAATPAEVIAFFGHGRLAKELYSETEEIDDVQEVD